MANVGVVYSTNTGRIRWIHRPDVPGGEISGANLLPGEAIQVMAQADVITLQTQLNAITGKTPSGDRYVIVPLATAIAFNVPGAHIMDPLIDTIPNGMTAIAHATAGPGWTYTVLGGFVAPAASIGLPK